MKIVKAIRNNTARYVITTMLLIFLIIQFNNSSYDLLSWMIFPFVLIVNIFLPYQKEESIIKHQTIQQVIVENQQRYAFGIILFSLACISYLTQSYVIQWGVVFSTIAIDYLIPFKK